MKSAVLFSRLFSAPNWRKLSLCLLLSCSLLNNNVIAAQTNKVSLFVRELRNDQGDVIPIKDDIRQLILFFEREAHVNFEVRYFPMARLLNHVKNGEGIAFGLSKNTERLETMQFSESIYANYVWMVTAKDRQFNFNQLSDLQGKIVGVIRGVSYGDDFDRAKNELFRVEEDTSSHVARLKKLAMRRMDVMLFGARQSNPRDVEALLRDMQAGDKSHVLDAKELAFTVLDKPLRIDELHFAASIRQHRDIIKRLNIAIARGKKNGEILRIITPK